MGELATATDESCGCPTRELVFKPMENIGAPDFAPRVFGNVTEYPGIPGPKGLPPKPGVVPGTDQACPCPNMCPFHSKHTFMGGANTVTAGMRLVDVGAKPVTQIDRISALVSTFLDGMIDELATRVTERVVQQLDAREAQKAHAALLFAEREREEYVRQWGLGRECSISGHMHGGFNECVRCGAPNENNDAPDDEGDEIRAEEARAEAPDDEAPVDDGLDDNPVG